MCLYCKELPTFTEWHTKKNITCNTITCSLDISNTCNEVPSQRSHGIMEKPTNNTNALKGTKRKKDIMNE
jgi:hypothetical protein